MASPNESECLTERDTAKRLKNLGKNLLRNNATVDKILEVLDKLELELSMVNQSPTEPIQESLLLSMKALISEELLRSTDEDLKISVTSCIAEVTRITAPDTPYDDELMKEIFKLMVAAFDKLSHVSGRCYEKALAIIDNVAKIRLCLVMIDLECDDLIIEMFQHFLRVIRSSHPQNVIDSMESIMTVVLEESDVVSPDLLKPVLDSIRKENETISPISRTLAEKVVTNCAVKLKPYLMRAVESSGRALDEYAQIVTSICQNGPESPHHDHSNDPNKAVVEAVENGLDAAKDADKQPCDVTKGLQEADSICVREAEVMDDTKSNIESANESNRNNQIIKKSGSKRKLRSDLPQNSKSSNAKGNSETGILESVRESESETQLNTVPKKRGRKPNSLMNADEGYDHSWIHTGKKTGKPALSRKNGNSSSLVAPSENCSTGKENTRSERIAASEDLVSQPKKECTAKPAQSGTGKRTRKPALSRENGNSSSPIPPSENCTSGKDNTLSERITASEDLVSQLKKDSPAKPVQSRTGKKTGKPALSRKNGNSSSTIPPSENCTTGKDNTKSERITASEDLVSQPKKESTAKPGQSRTRKKTGKPALSRKNGNSNSPIAPSENCTTGNDNTQSERTTTSKDLVSQPKKESTAKPAQSRKTQNISFDLSPHENPASGKENVNSKHKDTSEGPEALVSDAKTAENNNAGAPSNNVNVLDTSRPKRGRPRKRINSGNEDVSPSSVSKAKEVNLNPRLEVTSLESSGVRVKEEPGVMNDPEIRSHATIRKIRFTMRGNKKPAGAPKSVVAVMESNVSCEHEEKPRLGINGETENKDKSRSASQKEVKKRRRRNATSGKNLNNSSAIKEQITGSASKTLSGAEETPQPRLRRRRTTVKVEPSETDDLDNSLIGRRIKVWWPMDKLYYEGVIDSYDPVRGRHRILYGDGDVEILNLKTQRWEIIATDISQAEEQGLGLHKLAEASDIAQKINEKSELEPPKDANVNSKSRRGKACASISSKSGPVKSGAKSADTSALDRSGVVSGSNEDPPKIIERQESAAKPKTRRTKTGSDARKKRSKTDDLEKEKAQDV